MQSNSGINKVLLLGQVTDEPVSTQNTKGQDYVCIKLVTTETIKKGHDSTEHHEYHNIKIPEKLLQQDDLRLQAGMMLYIEGKLQTTALIDAKNIKRYNLDIIANKIEVLAFVPVTV